MENRKRYLVQVLCLAAVYYGAAKLGLRLAFETPSVTAVWAPTGIALAALVLFGFRLWPGVALGALLANASTGIPLLALLGITTGNTLEAVVGAYLLMRLTDFRPALDRVIDVLLLVALGAVLSTMVSATIGTGSLLATGEIDGADFGSAWRTWWLGDMGGDLVVAPALMVAVTHWPYERLRGRIVEAFALGLAVAVSAAFVFTRDAPVTFLLVPLPVLAAFRFRQPGAVATSLLIAAIAIPLTEDMRGPFADFQPDERLLLAQLLVGVISLTTLLLAAVVTERQRAEESVRYVAETLQESLLPASLPPISGVQAAVEFRPVAERGIVGGDFFEVVEQEDGSVGVAIGDALGKGAIAAADTALARYTLRAAALREREPSGILRMLNEAMLRQAPDHPCTVAYTRLERNPNGAMLTVSVAGHPKPLILRVNGAVEPIGYPAPPLGVREDLNLTDHVAQLAPGDAVVLYTDGLTDAYAPHRVVSADDLAVALQAHGGGTATEIIEAASLAAVPPDAERSPRDDILLLVLRLEERGAAAASA